MFVTPNMIRGMEQLYGVPNYREFVIPCGPDEISRISCSQKHGRDHDVTCYIRKGEHIVVIAKHFYPPGLYRAPSGGIHPNEDFEVGAKREIAEECGCTIAMSRFLLQTAVQFVDREHEGVRVDWRSFVFLADYLDGDFQFTDKDEIREVRLAQVSEFEEFGRIMRTIDRGGFRYRAALHEAVVELASNWLNG